MLREKIRVLISLFIISAILLGTVGCWDRIELEEQAFVVLMGIDKGKEINNFKVTIMIAIPSKVAGGGGGGGGGGEGGGKQEQGVSVVSMEAPAILSNLNTMNTFVSRRINLQHMKMLVIGEVLARHGVQGTLGALVRNREIRRSMNIMVARPSAEDFIKSLKPKLGTSPNKYVEDILVMNDSTGAIPKAFYHTFLTGYESYGDEAFAMIGTSREKINKSLKQEGEIPKTRAQFKTDIPGKGDPNRESGIDVDVVGTAIFRKEKMVGQLSGDETRIFNMLRGDFKRAYMTFRDPIERDKAFVIDMRQGSPPRVKVKIQDDKPLVDVTLSLEGDLAGFQSLRDYTLDSQKRKLLEKMVAGNLNERATKLIKKSQEQFDTDIFGFGNKGARQDFLTYPEWSKYHWLRKFKNAQVNVVVKFGIRRIGLNFGPPEPTH